MTRTSVDMRHTDLSALCHRYPDRAPILAVWSGDVHVTVTAEPGSDGGSVAGLVSAVEQYVAALAEWQQQDECACGRPAVTA